LHRRRLIIRNTRAELEMIVNIIILLLFSISLVPENIGFNFTFELRSLTFAIGVAGVIGSLILRMLVPMNRDARKYKQIKNLYIFGNLWSNGVLERRRITSIDIAFIAVTILTVISFVTKTPNINAFHYAFVQVGMAVVYFFIRTTKSTKGTKKIRAKNSLVNFIKEQRTKNKVPILIVWIGFIVAVIGLIQFVIGKPVVSTFGRTSYLGCFLAMNIPLAFGLVLATMGNQSFGIQYSVFGNRWRKRILSIIIFVAILGVAILTKSRTALIAIAVVLPIIVLKCKSGHPGIRGARVRRWKSWNAKRITGYGLRITSIICALVAVFLLFVGGKFIYNLKPMSASGRVLIWKVSAEMFRKNPISGVGFGNFANYYNLYQGEYFASGKGSAINKMTAGQVRHAYNWYLETAVEFGIFGLIVFGMFWWMILKEVYKTIKNIQYSTRNNQYSSKEAETEYRTPNTGYFLNIGMAGAVLCFMIMSLFQFPRMIIPTYLLFNVALAWIVNANEYTDLHRCFLTTNELSI